jgi:alpha-tubulin suppressor-like RCC1 family protein
VDVSGLTSGVAAIAAGNWHTCALTATGGVKCWGYNEYGQLGDGSTTDRTTPVDVSGLTSGVAAIAAGNWHTCALTATGGVKCWGLNGSGQLGDGGGGVPCNEGYSACRLTPTPVSGLGSGVTALAAGAWHTCALTTAGGVLCWGSNWYGQLGDGTTEDRLTPTPVSGLTSGVAALAAGAGHTCARTTAGALLCWGWNGRGQLGDGGGGVPCNEGYSACRLTPTPVSGLGSGVTALAAGNSHTCALTEVGGVKCWGLNWLGQLGDGTTEDRLTPVDVLWP